MSFRVLGPFLFLAATALAQNEGITLTADARGPATPLPRPWAGAIEGGPAGAGLFSAWQEALRAVNAECGFPAVRLESLFSPALRTADGFVYLDDVLDRVTALNVRPFLSLPPRPSECGRLAKLLIERYNITDIRLWHFEIEPATPADYAAAAAALRAVDPQLPVGARLPGRDLSGLPGWLAQVRSRGAPLDFLSLQPDPGSPLSALAGAQEALRQAGFPAAALQVAPWSSNREIPDFSHDEMPFAVFVLKANLTAPAAVGSVSFWRLSDLPSDAGPLAGVLRGGPGLVTFQGLVKPAFHAYRYLNALGEDLLVSAPGGVVTRRKQSGRLVVLAYNYPDGVPVVPPPAPTLSAADRFAAAGAPRTLSITLTGLQPGGQVLIEWVDPGHANAAEAWRQMGSPEAPSRQALDSLRSAARAAVVEYRQADDAGRFSDSRSLPAWGMLLLREL